MGLRFHDCSFIAIKQPDGRRGFMAQCILLVEDESTVLQVVRTILETEGLVVLTAKDGPEALSVLECHNVDALLTDLRIPGMNGHELILEARKRFPHLPVCCMTAYAEDSGLKDVPLVRKPFRAHELVNTVNEVMARAKAQAHGQDR
jgi:CheY-like chemotaxis protein